MRLQQILLAATILLLPYVATDLYACQCRERQPPCNQYWEADAVFIGSVTEIIPPKNYYSETHQLFYDRVMFNVERSFRGIEGDKVEFAVWLSSCRYGFEVGKRYLVYGYLNSYTNKLDTSYCSRTTELSQANDDMEYINRLATASMEQHIVGLLADGQKKLSRVAIIAEGSGKRYRTVSDKKGWFKLMVAESGRYRVRIFLPQNVGVGGTVDLLEKIDSAVRTKKHFILEYKVEVQSGRCTFVDVPLLL